MTESEVLKVTMKPIRHSMFILMSLRFLFLASLLIPVSLSAVSQKKQVLWKFDNLKKIGSIKLKVEGHPKIVSSPVGKAVEFNGVDDALFFDDRPLVGAKTFTIEAILRPQGGSVMQRWMHIAETDPKTGLDSAPAGTNDATPRFLFEIRVEKDSWYLDGFMSSNAGSKVLAFPAKLYPINAWYAVVQTYDGKMYRTYVDGELQGETELDAYVPHGPGHMMVGSRINRVNYFHGDVAEARFSTRALSPSEFLKVPK